MHCLCVCTGLRTGDAPDVAAIVQEKFDMELEMAKTLIQQECEETIESEQVLLFSLYSNHSTIPRGSFTE